MGTLGTPGQGVNLKSFHSINVPSEWGHPVRLKIHPLLHNLKQREITHNHVSIQLMSPASGDFKELKSFNFKNLNVSIQLMSPASGDLSIPASIK